GGGLRAHRRARTPPLSILPRLPSAVSYGRSGSAAAGGPTVARGRKVASTMYQLVAEPKVTLPSCGPAALDRMSSRSEEALPCWASMRYGTIWLLPAATEPGWPPVMTAATTSSPAGIGAVGPTVAEVPTPCDTATWSSAPTGCTNL